MSQYSSISSVNAQASSDSERQTIFDIESQSRLEITVEKQNTIWHSLLPKYFTTGEKYATQILSTSQSNYGVGTGVILVLLYMIGLYTFDRELFGNISTVYSAIILTITLPASILYFGTLNRPICLCILRKFTFWFKMWNVVLCNTMSVVW
eukprot:27127_1